VRRDGGFLRSLGEAEKRFLIGKKRKGGNSGGRKGSG